MRQLVRRAGGSWSGSGRWRGVPNTVAVAADLSGGASSSSSSTARFASTFQNASDAKQLRQQLPAARSSGSLTSAASQGRGKEQSVVGGGANPDDPDQILETLEASLEALALSQARITKKVTSILERDAASAALASGKLHTSSVAEDETPTSKHSEVDPHAIWEMLQEAPEGGVPASLLRAILDQVEPLFSARRALVEVPVPASEHGLFSVDPKIVIVGDTHGQINDVLWVLHRHGPPCLRTTYVFNGDIADRGSNAVEIFALAFAFKIRYPDNVIVLRGNHEHAQMNERTFKLGGGFADECVGKHGRWLYDRFRDLFFNLPLFAVIQNDIFVVHGGLPRTPVTLEQLRKVELMSHFPAPRSREDLSKGVASDWTEQDAIVFDSQWADPHEGRGIVPSRRGGDAIKFGSDITERFLKENNLQLLLRSHETAPHRSRTERPPGYWFAHGGSLLTVFSASNYGGVYQNLGAVAVFRKAPKGELPDGIRRIGDLTMELDQYYAPGVGMISAAIQEQKDHMASINMGSIHIEASRTKKQRFAAVEGPNLLTEPLVPEELLHFAVGILCTHRERLWSFCHQHAGEDGRMDIEALTDELNFLCQGPGLPWSWLLKEEGLGLANSYCTPDDLGSDDFGVDIPEKTTLNYERLLGRFFVHWPVMDKFEIVQGVALLRGLIHKVVFSELSPQEAIDLFDVNGDGVIGMHDCQLVLERLIPALSERQVHHILNTLPWVQGGSMPIERCLLYLHLQYGDFPRPEDGFLSEVLPQMMRRWSRMKLETDDEVVSFGEQIFQAFHEIDTDGDGLLKRDEMISHLHKILPMSELGFNKHRENAFFEYLDVTQRGRINIFELFRAVGTASCCIRGDQRNQPVLASALREDMFCSFNAVIDSHRTVILSACRAMDMNRNQNCRGELPRQSFMAVMQALLQALPQSSEVGPFEMQLEALNSVLADSVRYDDLLADFEIVDSFQN